MDVAIPFARFASLEGEVPGAERRELLKRGQAIVAALKEAGRLPANQDWIGWDDERLDPL